MLKYIDGAWTNRDSSELVDVVTLATGMTLGRGTLSGPAKVAFTRWPKDWSRES